MLKKYMHLE